MLQTKQDVDTFLNNLLQRNQKCVNQKYEQILRLLPEMSRVRLYFIRKVKEHNEAITKICQAKEFARQEAARLKTEKKRQEADERKRLKTEKKVQFSEKHQANIERNKRVKEIHDRIKQLERELKILLNQRSQFIEELDNGKFDGFSYIGLLIQIHNITKEIRDIKSDAQKELNSGFDIFSAQIRVDYSEENLKSSFHHYYYQRFGEDFLRKKILDECNENLKNNVLGLIAQIPDYIVQWEDDLSERLEEIGEESRFDDFKSYFINWHSEVLRYIEDNSTLLSEDKLLKDIALIVFSNMIYDDEDENVDYFIAISKLVSDKLGRNVRLSLYQEPRELNHANSYKFTTPLSEIVEQERKQKKEKRLYPSDDGVISILWSAVQFFNGYALIWHPSHVGSAKHKPYKIEDHRIKSSFNNISPLFINRLQPIIARSKKGNIQEIVKMPDFAECIGLLCQPSLAPDFDRMIGCMSATIPGITKEQLSKIVWTKEQKYLDFLCEKHLPNRRAYYMLEVKINSNQMSADEEGFLFVLKEAKDFVYLLYENSLPARASILFVARKDDYNESVRFIHEYFSSQIINKRELLSKHKVDAYRHGIIRYTHINHTTFGEWRRNLLVQL
ncbi:MAG: hypothetical protein NC224_07480 [Bacteroides sp.]|nr:hypothetical protein [Bacteroides sp.]